MARCYPPPISGFANSNVAVNFDRVFYPTHDDKLRTFVVNVSEINRLYHLKKTGGQTYDDDVEYQVIAKINGDNNDGDVYVEMGMHIYGGGGGMGYGYAFLCRDPSVFMKLVLRYNNYVIKTPPIYESLKEDGIHLIEDEEVIHNWREIKKQYLEMRYGRYS